MQNENKAQVSGRIACQPALEYTSRGQPLIYLRLCCVSANGTAYIPVVLVLPLGQDYEAKTEYESLKEGLELRVEGSLKARFRKGSGVKREGFLVLELFAHVWQHLESEASFQEAIA
jgi:hypothetical protein